jgi:hypothetical protein
LKEDALDRTMWRACLGRSFGPVVRQTAKWMMVQCLQSETRLQHILLKCILILSSFYFCVSFLQIIW